MRSVEQLWERRAMWEAVTIQALCSSLLTARPVSCSFLSHTEVSLTCTQTHRQIDAHADTCVHTQRHTDTYIDT